MTTARRTPPNSEDLYDPTTQGAEHTRTRCTKCDHGFITEFRLEWEEPQLIGSPKKQSRRVESEEEGKASMADLNEEQLRTAQVISYSRPCACRKPKEKVPAHEQVSETAEMSELTIKNMPILGPTIVPKRVIEKCAVADRKTIAAGDDRDV